VPLSRAGDSAARRYGDARVPLLPQPHGFEGFARGRIEHHAAQPPVAELVDPAKALGHVEAKCVYF